MKGFVIPLAGVISVILLAGSVQSVAADHLEQDDIVINHWTILRVMN